MTTEQRVRYIGNKIQEARNARWAGEIRLANNNLGMASRERERLTAAIVADPNEAHLWGGVNDAFSIAIQTEAREIAKEDAK